MRPQYYFLQGHQPDFTSRKRTTFRNPAKNFNHLAKRRGGSRLYKPQTKICEVVFEHLSSAAPWDLANGGDPRSCRPENGFYPKYIRKDRSVRMEFPSWLADGLANGVWEIKCTRPSRIMRMQKETVKLTRVSGQVTANLHFGRGTRA